MPEAASVPLTAGQPSAISVRVQNLDTPTTTRQIEHDLRTGNIPDYVNRDKTHLNRILLVPPDPVVLRRRIVELREQTNPIRKMRRNAAIATAGIITFGRQAQLIFSDLPSSVQDAAVLAVAHSISERYGCNLIGAVLHLDEAAPHAHLMFESRNEKTGEAFAELWHGAELQTLAADAIRPFAPAIGRGDQKRKTPDGPTVHKQVRELHQLLPTEIDLRRQEVAALDRQIETRTAELAQLDGQARQAAQTRTEANRLMEAARARQQELDDRERRIDRRFRRIVHVLRRYATATAAFLKILDKERELVAAAGFHLPERPPAPEFPQDLLDAYPDSEPRNP